MVDSVNLDQLEKQLAENQFLGGQQPSGVDRDTYQQLKSHKLTTDANPNVFAWFYLVAKFSEAVQANWGGAAAAGGKKEDKKTTAAPAKKEEKPKKEEEDDEMDLFGDEEETEEDKAKLAEQKAKIEEYKKKKEGKPELIAKSLILLDVKPWEEETNLDELFKKITAIEMDGLTWKTEYKKEKVAYTIFKLVVGCVIEDAKVSTDELVEKIEAFEDEVQSVDIAVFSKI